MKNSFQSNDLLRVRVLRQRNDTLSDTVKGKLRVHVSDHIHFCSSKIKNVSQPFVTRRLNGVHEVVCTQERVKGYHYLSSQGGSRQALAEESRDNKEVREKTYPSQSR
ncbi:uncharacterized protein LOC112495126 [Cephus cinctus]|uniref:Uncharacterized protein LOC112495126 n=1 Tax=Cephus cinctus TaxID=211228 RepID=A0AAJ7RS14_CEPCN|nr:uncharacterized protein LOC112495126 [Cephus cinctus]